MEYKSVLNREFEISPQVMYNVVYMSCPEFVNYYITTQKYKDIPNIIPIMEEIWYDLKGDAIRNGVDKSLRKSSLVEYYKTHKKPKPIQVGKKRGRPKKII